MRRVSSGGEDNREQYGTGKTGKPKFIYTRVRQHFKMKSNTHELSLLSSTIAGFHRGCVKAADYICFTGFVHCVLLYKHHVKSIWRLMLK